MVSDCNVLVQKELINCLATRNEWDLYVWWFATLFAHSVIIPNQGGWWEEGNFLRKRVLLKSHESSGRGEIDIEAHRKERPEHNLAQMAHLWRWVHRSAHMQSPQEEHLPQATVPSWYLTITSSSPTTHESVGTEPPKALNHAIPLFCSSFSLSQAYWKCTITKPRKWLTVHHFSNTILGNVTNSSCGAIGDCLDHSKSLEYLNISQSKIGAKGLQKIAKGLENNSSLAWLILAQTKVWNRKRYDTIRAKIVPHVEITNRRNSFYKYQSTRNLTMWVSAVWHQLWWGTKLWLD